MSNSSIGYESVFNFICAQTSSILRDCCSFSSCVNVNPVVEFVVYWKPVIIKVLIVIIIIKWYHKVSTTVDIYSISSLSKNLYTVVIDNGITRKATHPLAHHNALLLLQVEFVYIEFTRHFQKKILVISRKDRQICILLIIHWNKYLKNIWLNDVLCSKANRHSLKHITLKYIHNRKS